MRTFVALDLPDSLRHALTTGAESLRASESSPGSARWVPTENLHLTLAFLGEMDHQSIDELLTDLIVRCERIAPVELVLDDPCTPVRSPSHATMLWARFADPTGGCAALASVVADAAAHHGVAAPGRRFTPHVTLARFRHPSRLDQEALALASCAAWSALEPGEDLMSVREVIVYTSTLTRSGARYTRQGGALLTGR